MVDRHGKEVRRGSGEDRRERMPDAYIAPTEVCEVRTSLSDKRLL